MGNERNLSHSSYGFRSSFSLQCTERTTNLHIDCSWSMAFFIVTARPGNRGSNLGKVNRSLPSTAFGLVMWFNQPPKGNHLSSGSLFLGDKLARAWSRLLYLERVLETYWTEGRQPVCTWRLGSKSTLRRMNHGTSIRSQIHYWAIPAMPTKCN
jgi:hypothetical protein